MTQENVVINDGTISTLSLEILANELNRLREARSEFPTLLNWADSIYEIAIEIDDRRDRETCNPDRGIWCKVPFIAEALIRDIGEAYEEYYITFAHNREGLFGTSLGHRSATFETVVGIKSPVEAFLLFRDRYGFQIPNQREILYEFKDGQFIGNVHYFFWGEKQQYPEDTSKPIDRHFFPFFFKPGMKILPEHVQKYFKDYIDGSGEIPQYQCLWDKKTLLHYKSDLNKFLDSPSHSTKKA